MTFVVGQRLLTNSLLRGVAGWTVDQATPNRVDHSRTFRQWSERLATLMEQARDKASCCPR